MMEGGWQPFMGHVYGVRLLGDVEYRYVGLTTKTLVRRKSAHFKLAARGRKTAFADWLRKQPDREMVHFQSLELVLSDLEDLSRAEQDWILMLREEGHRLLNLNDGGWQSWLSVDSRTEGGGLRTIARSPKSELSQRSRSSTMGGVALGRAESSVV